MRVWLIRANPQTTAAKPTAKIKTKASLSISMKQFGQVEVTSRNQWRAWLTNHHTQVSSI
ncbi:MAG: hypothetical protein AAFR24_11995 [Cyanobacteria bacterium J06627_3]